MSQQKHNIRSGEKLAPSRRTKRIGWIVGGAVVIAVVVASGKFRSWSGSQPALASQKSEAATTASPFAPTIPNKTPAPKPAPEGMVWIPGGEFSMGSDAASESLCGLRV